MTWTVLEVPAPWAFMILDLSTSAGEHTAGMSATAANEGAKADWLRRFPGTISVLA